MRISRIIKYLFLSIIGILIIEIGIQEMFDNRPFQFEKYKTEEEFKKAVEIKFPIGSNLEAGIKILELSSADCHIYKAPEEEKRYVIIGSCDYDTNFISLHPFEHYRVALCADKNNRIVEVSSRSFYELPWW